MAEGNNAGPEQTRWEKIGKNLGARAGRIAGAGAGKVASEIVGRSPEDIKKPGFWSEFFKGIVTEGTLHVAEDTEAMDTLEQKGTGYLKDQITEVAEGVKVDTVELAKKAQNKINPDNISAYQIFRNKLVNEQDPFLKRMLKSGAARLLSFGTTIASYVSASWVDRFTQKDEWKENRETFASIIAGAVNKAFPDQNVPQPS
jgi:hypothetical protein